MIRALLLAALLVSVAPLPARADDLDARWQAVSDGVAKCWVMATLNGGKHTDYPEPYRAVCIELQRLQAQMGARYQDQETRATLNRLEYDLRAAEGK